MTDFEYYRAAKTFYEAGAIFQEATKSPDHPKGFSASKASEVLIAAVTNTWLKKHYGNAHITLDTAATGKDGFLSYDGGPASSTHAVEIKSSKGTQFLFGRKFLPSNSTHHKTDKETDPKVCEFEQHVMVVMGQFSDNKLNCLYITHGPEVMKRLAKELENDTQRDSYKPDNRGELRIFTATQPVAVAGKENAKGARKASCTGLNNLAETCFPYTSSALDFRNENWIKVLKDDELKVIVQELESSN